MSERCEIQIVFNAWRLTRDLFPGSPCLHSVSSLATYHLYFKLIMMLIVRLLLLREDVLKREQKFRDILVFVFKKQTML